MENKKDSMCDMCLLVFTDDDGKQYAAISEYFNSGIQNIRPMTEAQFWPKDLNGKLDHYTKFTWCDIEFENNG